MRVTFVGVGEAFDERLANTSLFVEAMSGGRRRAVLLDCGFTAAAAFFACAALDGQDREAGPDAVWISHCHGDHFFGLPYLLARLHEAGRTAPLVIGGGRDVPARVEAAVALAYPGLPDRLGFPVEFATARPGKEFTLAGLSARCAPTGHGEPCLALRLDTGDGSLCYGGDGALTGECLDLAAGCDLLVAEAYGFESGPAGHGSVAGAVAAAAAAGAGALAVVHVRRDVRRDRSRDIRRLLAGAPVRAFLPEPGDTFGR